MNQKHKNSKNIIYFSFLGFFLFVVSLFFAPLPASAACASVPLTGDYVVGTSCTFSAISGVFGVDNGKITIDANRTLTVNDGQTIVWGPNKSLVINGSIAINDGGQLKQARIWVKDSDGDGYATADVPIAQIGTPGAGYVYRSQLDVSMTNTTDLAYDFDDTSTSIYPGTLCDGNCSTNDSDGTCISDGSKCAGDCAVCSGAGPYNCAASDALCLNNTSSCGCSGSDTSFSCTSCTDDPYGVCGHPICSSYTCDQAYDDGGTCATCKTCSSGSCVNVDAGTSGYGCTTGDHYRCDGEGNCTAPCKETFSLCVTYDFTTGGSCAYSTAESHGLCQCQTSNNCLYTNSTCQTCSGTHTCCCSWPSCSYYCKCDDYLY